MTDHNGTDLNFVKVYIKQECSALNTSIEDVDIDYEEIIKTETDIVGGSWVHQDMEEQLQNEDWNLGLGNAVKQLLNDNSNKGITDVEDPLKSCERTINLGSNRQTDNENGDMHEKMGLDGEQEIFDQGRIDHLEINDKVKKEILEFSHGALEEQDGMNDANAAKQNSECSIYLCRTTKEFSLLPTEKKYECNCIANKLSFKISKCNERSCTTIRKSHLVYNIKSHHTMEKPYKCNECSYTATRQYHLLCHIQSRHTMEKPYKCNECSYTATRQYHLLCHIKSRHTMEKPYKCNECSYTAAQKCDLLRHIKSRHTMEKPYKCNECSYTAGRQYHLLCHIKSHHTMEKLYKCNECSYTAAQNCDLLRHIQSRHTMEKPYKCNDCSYTAAQKCNLLRHVNSRHTMEKPYKCNECSYTAAQKCRLLSHIKSRHTMEKPDKCN